MKKLLRKLKRKYPGFLPAIIYYVLRGLYTTWRVRLVNSEIPLGFHSRDQGTIQIMWHGRLITGPVAYQGKKGHILISSHGDGEMIARITGMFGFSHVRGSSSKGGNRALKQMLTLAKRNEDIIITPDGPRGPAEVVKPGVAEVARLSGLPVIPFAASASACKRFRSWDRFMIPLPFSSCFFVWGEPLYSEENEDIDTFRLRIEKALREVTAAADRMAQS